MVKRASFCLLSCLIILFLSSVSAIIYDPQDKQVFKSLSIYFVSPYYTIFLTWW